LPHAGTSGSKNGTAFISEWFRVFTFENCYGLDRGRHLVKHGAEMAAIIQLAAQRAGV